MPAKRPLIQGEKDGSGVLHGRTRQDIPDETFTLCLDTVLSLCYQHRQELGKTLVTMLPSAFLSVVCGLCKKLVMSQNVLLRRLCT